MKLLQPLTCAMMLATPTMTAAQDCPQSSQPDPHIDLRGDHVHYTGNMRLSTIESIDPVSILVLESPGGQISALQELTTREQRIVIINKCNSACVMLLVLHDNACVDSSVPELHFHSIGLVLKIRQTGRCERVVLRTQTKEFVKRLPTALQTIVQGIVDSNEPVAVSLEEFLSFYPEKACAETALQH